VTFMRLLSEATTAESLPATEDLLAVGLPLLRQLDELHQSGRVSRLSGLDGLIFDGNSLQLETGHDQAPLDRVSALRRWNPTERRSGIDVVRRVGVDHGFGDGDSVESLDVHRGTGDLPDRPVFVVGYRAWEQLYGHHDVLTDIHLAGMLLVSYVAALDLDIDAAVDELALRSRHLHLLNAKLHPVVVNVLSEMISPDRHRRPSDLTEVIFRLENHRDLPADLDLSTAYEAPDGWQRGVLTAMRERVFDVGRRNRALYFKPSLAALSLTEASVPLLVNIERIKPKDLLTWTGETAAAFRSGRAVDLERWCRFEDAPHLAPGLDKLIASERKLRTEHGQGRLRLIVAFLRWSDPDTGELVNSPLITLRADLSRKKGVRDRYRVRVDDEGEINPVLRHVFRKRFAIALPERVGTDHESILRLVADLETTLRSTNPAILVDLVDTPRVSAIRRRAQLRVDAYVRRRAQAQASSGLWRRQEHSYDGDDWRPLGLALYRRFVEPAELPLRTLAGAPPRPRRPQASSLSAHTTNAGERVASELAMSVGDVNARRWEVDLCAVTLASLGSRRSSLSRDYDALLADESSERTKPGTPFDSLFSPAPKPIRHHETALISVEQILVLPADDAQAAAVRRGLSGESLIIQGPPGTGKSQTITNLIAASVAEGRRVLFVCEKRAALDVVAQRLRQVGLDQLVAIIHDSQLDRKAFISDLGQVYNSWLKDHTPTRPAEQRESALAEVHALLGPLERIFVELGDARGGRRSAAEIIERLVMLRFRGVVAAQNAGEPVPPSGSWLDARDRLSEVVAELARVGRNVPLGRVDVLRVAPEVVCVGDPVVAVRAVGEQLLAALAELRNVVDASLSPSTITMEAVESLLSYMPLLSKLAENRALEVLDLGSGVHLVARGLADELGALASAAEATLPVLERWRVAPNAVDTAAALDIARSKERSAFKFMSHRWRQVKNLLAAQYRFELHQIEPLASNVLEELLGHHLAQASMDAHQRSITDTFGVDDLAAVFEAAEQLRENPIAQSLLKDGSTRDLAALEGATAATVALGQKLVRRTGASLADIERVAQAMVRASVVDERTLVAWGRLAGVDSSVLVAALDETGTLDEVEAWLLSEGLRFTSVQGSTNLLEGAQLDQTVELLLDRYRSLLAANAALVASRTRQGFLENIALSEASMAGRSLQDKERKRVYRAGRKVLEREFDKKMRFRSIRELGSGDAGAVVRDLKPIWLMSPLSVSDTLPLDEHLFDVVIFDEASQIPVEDAVPTLFRASQTVVVGDRMQLPPTRFFATTSDDGDDVVADTDDGSGEQGVLIPLDADSFLTQADSALDSTMLTWHYRSRHESLIGYSNHAFYDARLATIPDRGFDTAERSPILVSGPDEAAEHLSTSLQRPISFHMIQHGVYEDRRNVAEADYVAELVRAMLVSDTSHTIGIVAFSEAQQTAIETSLEELAVFDRHFGELLDSERIRSDDGEFVGLFVKNLENVQGDERDVIIMSVCYGKNRLGKMRMNFGPINQTGGERRLNVIFSRARQHMMIVSSIVGNDITNTHNEGAAHLARFLDYASAESAGGAGGELVLKSLRSPGGPDGVDVASSAVATELASRLRDRGHDVDTNIGRSAFRVDVAVRSHGSYSLGIMVDPGRETSPTARLVAEAGVLDAMKWPITRVLASEWWDNPDRVLDRIELTLDQRARP
jgi:hypothetical protein